MKGTSQKLPEFTRIVNMTFVEPCKKCYSRIKVIILSDLRIRDKHYAEERCGNCGRFKKWASQHAYEEWTKSHPKVDTTSR